MKLWKMITLCTVLLGMNAHAIDKVVYGEDNRLDLFEVSSPLELTLAKSTAGAVKNYNLESLPYGKVKLTGNKLSVCSDEKFNGQLTSAFCSGFLVEHDEKQYLVTAGHCIKRESDCKNFKWVFDYAVTSRDQDSHVVDSSSIYSCTKIVDRKLERGSGADYAVLELDRKVTGREPLKMRSEGKISTGEQIVVIGHPTGLPSKVSGDAYVRNNSRKAWFASNLDTFGGNSGSAVFNATNGQVEGILVRGHTDYTYDSQNACRRPVYCDMIECRGEDVTRITTIDLFN